eukprot:CAMPEP_0198683926 /NCGR_PEP_ID=MMETSP1468-20131203/11422_1 /TAXON_ID=1461545 /ORGANISM="Mantoniella sp, Strain CCMP1436" /LENGTH=49 /DNA_ID= /DNA_START= /DNA_END= /DNA_ORIENTATION=
MSARPILDAAHSGVDPSSEVARFTFAPCASSFSTTFECSCSEAMYNAVL